jgi:hypothetical protein
MDDAEFEVTPLDTEFVASDGGARSLPPRVHGPRRRLQRAGTLGAVLAVLLVGAAIVVTTADASGGLSAIFFGTPAATATLPIDADLIYFEHSAPWSASKPVVDGKALAIDLNGNVPAFVRLPRGRHTLTYQTTLFPALRCTISVPASPGDTCPLGPHTDLNLGSVEARAVDLGATPARLSADEEAALAAAVHRVVDLMQPAVEVRPGEQYLTDAGVQTATQQLLAMLVYQLALHSTADCATIGCTVSGCAYLCVSAQGNTTAWQMVSYLTTGWRYTTESGAPVGTLSSLFGQDIVESWAALEVRWADGWQVSEQPDFGPGLQPGSMGPNPTCNRSIFWQTLGLYLPFSEARTGASFAAGCLYVAEPLNAQGVPLPFVRLLYRFGVMLAVDAAAHQALPSLPVADVYEQGLAQQIAVTPQG